MNMSKTEASIVAVGAARGTPRTPFFEGCAPSPLAPSFASSAAIDFLHAKEVGAASAPSGRRRSGKGKGGKGGGGGSGGGGGGGAGGVGGGGGGGGSGGGSGGVGGGGGGSGGSGGGSGSGGGGSGGGRGGAVQRGGSGGGQRQQQQRPHETPTPQELCEWFAQRGASGGSVPCTYVIRTGASESALSSTALAEALHTITLDSGASRYFFRDSTIVTPLPAPVAVSLADPSGGPVLARSSTILPCPAVLSGSLSGLHLPSFSTNLVSTAALQDAMVTTTTTGGQRVMIYTCTRTGRHLATFTHRLGSGRSPLFVSPPLAPDSSLAPPPWSSLLPHLHGMHSHLLVSCLPRSLPPLPPLPAPPCLPCVERRQRAAPHSSSFPSTTAPLQTLHMDVWGPARVSGQGRERYFTLVVGDYKHYTIVFPLRSKGQIPDVLIPWIRAARLQICKQFREDLPVMRLHSDLLWDFCRGEGILRLFTLPASPQQNGIAERRIGLVMEVARTSMIHAAALHFLWPFAVRYTAHQLNLWPRVSLQETSPTLRWTGKVGDASVFRGFAPLGVSQVGPLPWAEPVEVNVDSGAAGGGAARGSASEGAEPAGAEPGGAEPTSAEPGGAEPEGTASGGAEPRGTASARGRAGASPWQSRRREPLSSRQLCEWFARHTRCRSGTARAGGPAAGGTGAGGAGATSPGGAGGAGAGGTGGAVAAGPKGACTRGTGAVGAGGVGGDGAGDPGAGGARAGGTGAGGTGAGDLGAGDAGNRGTGGAGAAGPGGSRTRDTGAAGPGGVGGARAGDPTAGGAGAGGAGARGTGAGDPRSRGADAGGAGARGAGAGGTGTGGAGVGGTRTGGAGAGGTAAGGIVQRLSFFVPPPPPSPVFYWPYSSLTVSTTWQVIATEHREPASCPTSPVCAVGTGRHVPRPHPPPVLGTHIMALCPLCVPLRVALPSPPASSLTDGPDPMSNLVHVASPTVTFLLATVVTDPSFESAAASSLVAELVDFAAACRLDYAASLVAKSESECPPSVGGTYVDTAPPPGANIVDGMWIFRVKRPPGSPPAFKARYVARGFNQRQGVDFFQTFSPTPKMTTLRVLLHVAAQRYYELRSLDFSSTFLQGSLHEEIWLRRPPGFTGSFPAGTQWSLRQPVYGLPQAPREWHNTLRTMLAALGFAPSNADPSLFLRTDTSLLPFYVFVYVDNLLFATANTEALALVILELQKRHTCTDLGELHSYLGLQITQDRARHTITLTHSHMVHQVLQRFGFRYSLPQSTPLPTDHSLSAPPSDESVEPSG
ncbi:unnamed protein product [Closterium sp. NIES-54]